MADLSLNGLSKHYGDFYAVREVSLTIADGEFLVLLASFRADFWYAFLAGLTLILGAAYTLWLVKRVVFGPVANHHVAELTDVNGRELLVLGVLALAVLGLGLWPAPLLDVMRPTVENLVQQITVSKL